MSKTEEFCQYCKENIPNFELRYDLALDKEGEMRCPIEYADNQLYCEIRDRLEEWCDENGENIDDYDINEMF